ncbi:hypothetical protein QUF80_03010 [Desulfococcaceae bacterium HSG8]|nr:hypothetical protein [Desulfococcaceae bacterium HSG8]
MGDYTVTERQRRWRERQKAKGLKIITVRLKEDTIFRLNKERMKTGEKFNEIIERAISTFLNSE